MEFEQFEALIQLKSSGNAKDAGKIAQRNDR
jgi:hypothetical protein